MGVPMTNPGGLSVGDWLRRDGQEDTTMVEKDDNIRDSVEHTVRGITGGKTKTSGRGQGRIRPGIKVRAADRHQKPDNIQVDG